MALEGASTLALKIRVADADSGTVEEHTFDRSPVRFGRAELNDLQLDRGYVSSWHGLIQFDGEGIRVVDLGSTNGTFLDGARLARNVPTPVATGQPVAIGRLRLELSSGVTFEKPKRNRPVTSFARRIPPSGDPASLAPMSPPPPGPSSPALAAAPGGVLSPALLGAQVMAQVLPQAAPAAAPGSVAAAPPPAPMAPARPVLPPNPSAPAAAFPRQAEVPAPFASPRTRTDPPSYAPPGSAAPPASPGTAAPPAPPVAAAPPTPPPPAAPPRPAPPRAPTPTVTLSAPVASPQPAAGAGGTMGEEALALLRSFAEAYLPPDAVPTDVAGIRRMLEGLAEVLETAIRGYLELRSGHEQFGAEMGIRVPKGDGDIARIGDADRMLGWLLAPADGEARAQHLASAFADLMIHQVALLNGVRAGARALLTELSPDAISDRMERKGTAGIGVWPLRQLALLRAVEDRHREFTEEESAVVDVLFGKDFARAYTALTGRRPPTDAGGKPAPRRRTDETPST